MMAGPFPRGFPKLLEWGGADRWSNSIRCLVCAAIGLNLADALMTVQAMSMGFQELNAFMASLLDLGLFLPVKAVYCLMIYGVSRMPSQRLVTLGLSATTAILVAIVGWNLTQFIGYCL